MDVQNRHTYHAVLIGMYSISLSVLIPYLMILISQEQYVGFFDLTFQHCLVILPTVIASARLVIRFFQHGYADLTQRMDRAAIAITKTFLVYTGSMMLIGIAEFFSVLNAAQIDWITYFLFYSFLSQTFYFAFVSLPITFWIEPYRKK